MRKFILILAGLLVFGLPTAGQATRVWWVDDDGPADFHNIQDAINASGHGDTIIVKPGTYSQNLFFIGRAITVRSEDPNVPSVVQSTIITVVSGYSVTFDFLEGNNSIITGFTFTGRGIYCYGTSPTIEKNIIKDCANNGIYGEGNIAPVILDNTIKSNAGMGIYSCNGPITGNTISGNGCGIASCNSPITNNIISDNKNTIPGFGLGGGLYNCNGKITGNIITNNYASYQGGGLYECTGDISYNYITGNRANTEGGGMFNCHGNIGNNIIAGNVGYRGGGLCNCGGFTYNIYNNTITGNRADYGGALYNCIGYVRNNIIAFNEAIQIGGIYGPCQNSYNDFWLNQGGTFGGGAAPSPKDMVIDPRFAVDGHWDPNVYPLDPADDFWIDGDYHVKSETGRWDPNSQFWVKDAATSQCIDAGDPNSVWTAELWPHGKRINLGAYGGTPEASMSTRLDLGNVADIDNDGLVDFNDMALLIEMWLSDQILLAEDLNRDRIVNLVDFAILLGNWRPGAPSPNPMTWATPPYATSPYSIAMEATTATSTDWSGVEYYFENFQNPQFNSGWISFTPGQPARWENTGLTPDTEYWYRVKARNKGNHLETGWSPTASATTSLADTTPPTPNPMTWAAEPCAISPTSIRMVATTASDGSGVQYYFQCTSDANYNSSWRDSSIYEVNSLPKGVYTFVTRARDKSPNHNTTGDSNAVSVDLTDRTPPTPDPMTWATPPYATSSTSIRMVATTASDDSGVQYYFQCTSDANYNSSWQDSPTYDATSLKPAVYTFVTRARDKSLNYNTTGDSNAVTIDLKPPTPDPMTWATPPYATSSTSIRMVATTASDDSGVQYFFQCTSHPAYSSTWQDSPIYNVTSLNPAVYTFVTRARDKSPNHNTTGNSNAVAVDIKPPTPDPMTWATPPYATSSTSIRMVATTASDDSGVQYYFQCTSDATYDSSWQDSPIYNVTSLSPAVYTFVTRARDNSPNHNTTSNSTAVTVDLKPPTPDPMTWATTPYRISPTSIRMVATTASDDSGVQYFFECTSHPAHSSTWQDSPTYDATSLTPGFYTFVTRARDKSTNHNTTGNSTPVTVDFNPPTPNPMLWASGGEPKKVDRGGGSFNWWAVMTAAEATDESGGIQYFFECTNNSDFSSGWQSNRYYEVKLGGPSVIARFRVRARDLYGNETGWSSELPANP